MSTNRELVQHPGSIPVKQSLQQPEQGYYSEDSWIETNSLC